jgi:hypothetical protein
MSIFLISKVIHARVCGVNWAVHGSYLSGLLLAPALLVRPCRWLIGVCVCVRVCGQLVS